MEARKTFALSSPAFVGGQAIPRRHACDGEDVSPELRWSSVPAGTKSFALIMDDPDAPAGTWVHWVLYDLPAELTGLPEGVPRTESVLGGAKHGASWGVERFERAGYGGPCPPPGKPHRYFFRLYALSAPLGLKPRATKAEVLGAMKGRVLGEAALIGLYGR